MLTKEIDNQIKHLYNCSSDQIKRYGKKVNMTCLLEAKGLKDDYDLDIMYETRCIHEYDCESQHWTTKPLLGIDQRDLECFTN